MTTGGTAATINEHIHAFVSEKANRRLRPGTGAYSTLFRGSLFGLTDDVAVANKLKRHRVDVLWLGANPCVPRSLDYITSPPAHEGDFPTFVQQMRSGLFPSARWDDSGNPLPDFNPLEQPKGNWRIYRDMLLRVVGSTNGVAMANVLPWGSTDIKGFLNGVGELDEDLLRRALRFADDLNVLLVSMLRPRLLIVPFSIGRNRRIHAVQPWQLSLREAGEPEQRRISVDNRSFVFTTAVCQRGSVHVPTAFLPHPAALRVPGNAEARFVTRLGEIIGGIYGR